MLYRFIYLGLLLITGLFVTPIISLPLALLYAMRWYAPELIMIGYVFDVYFGGVADIPYYTIGLALLILIAEISKRFLMVKNSGNYH